MVRPANLLCSHIPFPFPFSPCSLLASQYISIPIFESPKTLNLPTKATSNTWKKNKLKQRHPDRLRRLCTPSASTEPSAPALAPLASTCSFSAGLDWLISTWRCRNRRRFVWENHGRFREIRSKNRKVERIVEIIWIRYCHNVFFFSKHATKGAHKTCTAQCHLAIGSSCACVCVVRGRRTNKHSTRDLPGHLTLFKSKATKGDLLEETWLVNSVLVHRPENWDQKHISMYYIVSGLLYIQVSRWFQFG